MKGTFFARMTRVWVTKEAQTTQLVRKLGAEEAHLACGDWSSDEEAGVQETAAPAVAAEAEHVPDVDITEEEISAMQGI